MLYSLSYTSAEILAVPVEDVGVCLDIDTPEDSAAALELL